MIIKKRKKKIFSTLFLIVYGLLFLECASTTIPVAFPRYPKKLGAQLRDVLKGKKNVIVIAAKPKTIQKNKLGNKINTWGTTIEASLSKGLNELGYYKIIDVANRKDRLRALVDSQSGLSKESLEIGREFQANMLFSVRMTKAPKIECRIEEIENVVTSVTVITARSLIFPNNAGNVNLGRPTGVSYVTIFVEAKISNIETGLSITELYTQSLRKPSKTGNRACASPHASFDQLIIEAGRSLATSLSPKMSRLSVSLMEDSPDMPSKISQRIKPYFANAIKWAISGDMDEAKVEWEEIMNITNNHAGGAIWNLGVYYWHVGDFQKAEKYFQQFKRKKTKLLDKRKRKLLSLFKSENRR